MRILIQQGAYYPWIGGAEVFSKKVAEHLAACGHQVDVVTGIWDKPYIDAPGWGSELEAIDGVNVHRVKTGKMRYVKTARCILNIIKKGRELDRRYSYDIIHGHIFPGMLCGALTKRRDNLLITLQGGDLADYWEGNPLIEAARVPMIWYALRKADVVHCVSSYLVNSAKRFGAKNFALVPNGVDTDVFRPLDKGKLRKQYGYGKEDRLIVSSSRLTPKNGLDHLIRAASKLPDAKLLIAGEGAQRPRLESLIKELGCGDRIRLAGFVEHAKLPEYMNIADVFCRPSLNEGFGISFIEAMACGVPAVGTNVGGIPDIIEDGKNGLLVEPKDPEGLAEALKKLMDDSAFRGKIAEEGRRTVEEKFRWDRVLKAMDEVYDNLHNRGRRK